jgi:hypothetical protein
MPIISPTPKSFALCAHTTPPTPVPKAPLNKVTGSYPGHCQACDISYHRSSESMIIGLYNGKIRDQSARLLIAKRRKGTELEGRYDAEMTEEGERRIREWRLRRDEETLNIWEGVVGRWDGVRVKRDIDAKEEKEGRMRVWIGAVEQD